MSEARILAAFWQPNSKRFCELTGNEIRERTRMELTSPEFRQLSQHRLILRTKLQDNFHVYRLSPAGERRVSEMVVMNTLPKIARKLTAKPQDKRRMEAAE